MTTLPKYYVIKRDATPLEQWDEAVNGFVLPEKWCVRITEENIEVVGRYYDRKGARCYKSRSYIGKYYASHNLSGNMPVMGESYYGSNFVLNEPEGYTEITFHQFKKYVLKEKDMTQDCEIISTPKTEPMKDRTITTAQAQSIIDVACQDWKHELAEAWGKAIALKTSINVDEKLYQRMRSSCTPEQHTLFDSVFGKDKKEFTSDDLKIGEWMKCNDDTYILKNDNNTFLYMKCKGALISRYMKGQTPEKGKKVTIEFTEVND